MSFKKVYQTSANYKKCDRALNKLYCGYQPEFSIYESCMYDKNLINQGVYQIISVCTNDIYDKRAESVLKQKNINFEKHSLKEIFDTGSIFNRIKLNEYQKIKKKELVPLNTSMFDKIFQKEETYIGYIGKNGIDSRYDIIGAYIGTGLDIDASEIYLRKKDGRISVNFQDGRHRYAYFRDLGLDKIPFAMDELSVELAEKYGLL